ncbi:unnamed protein product [Mycena citricolor]|uniref:Uncharacterized protein n=1 Tax=Mycena citricolor TaxID=2018698 RepID=A0AAD2HUC0_9AGAR|nr:unnamed protein product [Mycena citricolor]
MYISFLMATQVCCAGSIAVEIRLMRFTERRFGYSRDRRHLRMLRRRLVKTQEPVGSAARSLRHATTGGNDLESPLLDTWRSTCPLACEIWNDFVLLCRLVNLSITTAANSWAGRVKELSRATVRLFASDVRVLGRCSEGSGAQYPSCAVEQMYDMFKNLWTRHTRRLQSQGTLVRTYDLPDAPQWAHLSHHPDGCLVESIN